MVRDVKLKTGLSLELEELLPNDRVVTVQNGYTYLYDTCVVITEDMIEEEL